MGEMRAVVMFSGGAGSWAAAKRTVAKYGADRTTLLFCDTRTEDPDLYRFLAQAAENVGAELVTLADGRDIWQVFRDERFLGNSRIDPCSKILKRAIAERWLAEHRDPADTVRVLGIDWTEIHRFERQRDRLAASGWRVEAPMCEAPYLDKPDVLAWMQREGLTPPRLYALGFAHNNCGGGCVKAGVGHFAHLYRVLPEVYAEWERQEQGLRDHLGKPVTILRDGRDGARRPLTLTQLRRRLDMGHHPDLFDIGGCGCMLDDDAQEARHVA